MNLKYLALLLFGCSYPEQPAIKIVESAPSASVAPFIEQLAEAVDPWSNVIGQYKTLYDFKEKHEGRAKNIRHVAAKLNLIEIKPGEVFSFNQVVGPRTVENGFSHAKEIFFGEMVDGIGGGTCQVSSTLFAAAIFSDLEVVERRPHSRPLKYIGKGLDATVAFPNQEACDKDKTICFDLKFRNPYSFPIMIRTDVGELDENGQEKLTILFWGQSVVSGPIKATWLTSEVTPYKQKMRKTGRFLGKWKRRVQSGSEGIAGALIIQNGRSQKKIASRYLPVDEIWDVGLGWDMAETPWKAQ